MKAALATALRSWIEHIWYEQPNPPIWLQPFSAVFLVATALRRGAYAKGLFKTVQVGCPVIVVGNVSVGGTGKTPFVCWLVGQLIEKGFKPGIVSRGYGGAARHPRIVQAGDDAALVGDEPLLLSRRCGRPVAVGRNRVAACRLLVEAGCDVIVSDDGLQHHALARDFEIVLVDAARGFGNGYCLPGGPLRESTTRLQHVGAVVVNGERLNLKRGLVVDGALSMRLGFDDVRALSGPESKPLSAFVGTPVHAVAGIGNPKRFFDMLRACGIELTEHPLADHARISAEDLRFEDTRPVLMTEKDAVKCAQYARPWHWYVPVTAYLDGQQTDYLLQTIADIINKRRAALEFHG